MAAPPEPRLAEPLRPAQQHPLPERELVREMPYEVVREITKEIPIEITREFSDVPYWQRHEFERQLHERKESRRRSATETKTGTGAENRVGSYLPGRRDPSARTLAPGGVRAAPGNKAWEGSAGAGGELRGRPWDPNASGKADGYLTGGRASAGSR